LERLAHRACKAIATEKKKDRGAGASAAFFLAQNYLKGGKSMKTKRIFAVLCVVLVLTCLFGTTAYAAGSGDVAGAVEGTWKTASQQIKTVVNSVVFPAIDLILAVFFFAKLGTAYFDYRKHGQFEWAAPAILFACLVFTLTAPLYIWSVVGI
jgi:hypothetical protein